MNDVSTGILALKPVALKRKAVANNDRVRYRVYVNHEDFVAVIAENALMAMKLSGVAVPHRIVRDLPLAQAMVENEQLIPHHLQPTAFIIPEASSATVGGFEPIQIETDMESKPFLEVGLLDLYAHKQLNMSTIDVSVLLNSLPGDSVAIETPSAPSQAPLANQAPAAQQKAASDERDTVQDASASNNDGGLSQEEVERLLSQPRA